MQLSNLSAKTLSEIADGYAGHAIDAAIRAVREDLAQRNMIDGKREIQIKVTFAPISDERGRFEDVDIEVSVGHKLPGACLQTRAIVDPGTGGILFKANVPENPRQSHIDDFAKGGGE